MLGIPLVRCTPRTSEWPSPTGAKKITECALVLGGNFTPALHMMLQGFGMICLMMYTRPNVSLFIQEEVKSLSLLQKPTHPSFSGLVTDFLQGADPCNVSHLTITISDFWHYAY